MMELNCPSLDYVMYEMTWLEFQLRLRGYRRQEKNKWYHTREIAYMVYCSIPKKEKNMTIDQFLPLGGGRKKTSRLSDRQKELLKEAQNRVKDGG